WLRLPVQPADPDPARGTGVGARAGGLTRGILRGPVVPSGVAQSRDLRRADRSRPWPAAERADLSTTDDRVEVAALPRHRGRHQPGSRLPSQPVLAAGSLPVPLAYAPALRQVQRRPPCVQSTAAGWVRESS